MIRRLLQFLFLTLFAFLFFHICCPYPTEPEKESKEFPSHYADRLRQKERILPAETFLMVDPSVALTASVAERQWNSCAIGAVIVMAICLFLPRGFCGYACPLGTIIDTTDMIGGMFRRFFQRKKTRHCAGSLQAVSWHHFKYVLLLTIVIAAVFGVSLAGYVAPIPIVTRAFVFLFAPAQTAYYRGWYQVPAPNVSVWISIAIFACLILSGFVQRRFWCRNLCPTGAMLSLMGYLRIFGKKVDRYKCNSCSRCVSSCDFGAISTENIANTLVDCVSCLECQSQCPTGAVSFGLRDRVIHQPNTTGAKPSELPAQRRHFFQTILVGMLGLFSILTIRSWSTANVKYDNLIRPPGSVPEETFLKRCVRCGECLHACPNDALQPCSLEFGEDRMWTPRLNADWSGCEPSCNNCGQVCPTGAIRAIPLEEKRVCRIGLAVVNRQTCLPYSGCEECQICVDECHKAGYDAIEFMRVGTKIDESGEPIEGSGFLVPVVLPDKCVGCGLCQTRCHAINVTQKRLFQSSAIQVIAGESQEDRLLTGSYRELRNRNQSNNTSLTETNEDDYLPDFLQ